MLQGFYCKTEVFIAFIMNYFFRVSQETFKQLNRYKVLAGTKNSRPVGFYSRNSTKSTVNPNTKIPQI